MQELTEDNDALMRRVTALKAKVSHLSTQLEEAKGEAEEWQKKHVQECHRERERADRAELTTRYLSADLSSFSHETQVI